MSVVLDNSDVNSVSGLEISSSSGDSEEREFHILDHLLFVGHGDTFLKISSLDSDKAISKQYTMIISEVEIQITPEIESFNKLIVILPVVISISAFSILLASKNIRNCFKHSI